MLFSIEVLGAMTPIEESNGVPPAETESNDRIKNSFWSVGVAGERYTYKAGDGYELLGNSGLVSVGYGYLSGRWYVSGDLDLIIGPFDPSRKRILDVDYQGTGFKLWWGYSAQELDLRHPSGGYGFTLGLSYSDVVGRVVGDKKELDRPSFKSGAETPYNYNIRVTNMTLTPGIFFCWLKAPRHYGNKKEQLVTRVEGYILTLAFSTPIASRYSMKYSYWDVEDKTILNEDQEDEIVDFDQWQSKRKHSFGKLKGFTFLVSLQILLSP